MNVSYVLNDTKVNISEQPVVVVISKEELCENWVKSMIPPSFSFFESANICERQVDAGWIDSELIIFEG